MNINIKLEGKEVTKSLVDLFSPITEFAGAIGDQVRIYRELSTLKTLQKAKNIADERGLKLSAPPIKFLVPFIEHSSIEEDTEESISDMWAKLLVSSSTEFKNEYNRFIRILNELSSKEAQLLNYICSSSDIKNSDKEFRYEDIEGNWNNSAVYITIRDILRENNLDLSNHDDCQELFLELRQEIEIPGAYISFFWVGSGAKNQYPYSEIYASSRTKFDDLIDYIPESLLISLGLIGRFISEDYWFENKCIKVYAYYVTPLGGSFYKACIE